MAQRYTSEIYGQPQCQDSCANATMIIASRFHLTTLTCTWCIPMNLVVKRICRAEIKWCIGAIVEASSPQIAAWVWGHSGQRTTVKLGIKIIRRQVLMSRARPFWSRATRSKWNRSLLCRQDTSGVDAEFSRWAYAYRSIGFRRSGKYCKAGCPSPVKGWTRSLVRES